MPGKGKQIGDLKKKITKKEVTSETEKSTSAKTTGHSKKKLCKYDNLQVYIFRVLKQVHPEIGVSKRTMAIMNSFIKDILDKICNEASQLSKFKKAQTISSKDIQAAVKLLLPGELAKHAMSEGTKALAKYTQTVQNA